MASDDIPQEIQLAIAELKAAIAENLQHLMNTTLNADLRKNDDLGKHAGVARKTIDRLLDPKSKHLPNLLNLVKVAHAFGLRVEHLVSKSPRLMRGAGEQPTRGLSQAVHPSSEKRNTDAGVKPKR